MKATIKEMGSPQIATAMETYRPPDVKNFALAVQLVIGRTDAQGGDIFDLQVCTPAWIASEYADAGYAWGRHMLIVTQYDPALIRRAVQSYVDRCFGNDWVEIAHKIGQVAAWEFENYQA